MAEDLFDPSLSSRFPAKHAERTFQWRDTGTAIDKAGLGKFGVLPFETLQQILIDTDIRSLIRLQSVSKNMKRAVDTTREFQTLLRCAPDTIRIMTAAKVDGLIACRDLYSALCRPMCDLCDDPGRYLYLLACHRLCETCLKTNTRYRPVLPLQATEQFDLPMEDVLRLPILHVPKYCHHARYSSFVHNFRRLQGSSRNTTGWRLIDREVARRRRLADSGSSQADLSSAVAKRLHRLDHAEPASKKKQRLVELHELPSVESAYSASVLFPWYNQDTGKIGLPALCKACYKPTAGRMLPYITEEEYVKHRQLKGWVTNGVHRKDLY